MTRPWRALAAVAASALALTGVWADGGVPAVAAPGNAVVELPDEASASVAAKAANRRIAVGNLRTETAEVFANSDGTFTLNQNVEPVRVRRSGGWVAIDTTLERKADGTIAPRAATVDIALSGGGTAPFVTAGRDGKKVGLTWPGRLPAPQLSGDTATYPEVLPGVDLQVRAEYDGFAEALVVKDAEAARNPALAKIRFGTVTEGVTLKADLDGSLRVIDPAGNPVFRAPAPLMWDSTAASASAARLTGPAPAARRATMPATVDGSALVIVPDQEILTGPDTTYPVLLDPTFGGALQRWIHVNKKFPAEKGWNYDRNDGGAKVGYESRDDTTYRSFFRMNTAPVAGKHILSAHFRITLAYSWSCTARPVDLHLTGGFNENTAWTNQPASLRELASVNTAKGYSGSCPGGGIEFNALSAITEASAKRWPNVHLGLRAASETDTFGWKKFTPNAALEVTYNTVPAAPSTVSTDQGVPCVVGANRPKIGSTTPTLRATLKDADNSVRANFEWYVTNGALKGQITTAAGPAGTTFTHKIPAGAFADGALISWRVRGYDNVDYGPWGPWCDYQVDMTAPDKVPGVSSVDYPEEEREGGIGQPGTFTFTPNGVPDVTGYLYSMQTGEPSIWVPATGPDRNATVTIAPDKFENRLSVRSRDGANNSSAIRDYYFKTYPGRQPVGQWKLDETAGTTVADASGNGHTGTLAGGGTWQAGREGNGLKLDGTTGHIATTQPVVRSDQSFTVAGWAKLGSSGVSSDMISQRGVRSGSFDLGYLVGSKRWAFTMYSADADNAVVTRALSAQAPIVNAWTHLAGVYDSGAKQIRIYVNGELAGSATFSGGWTGTGGTQIGRARWGGLDVNYWLGELDDVRAYDRVVFADEIREIVDTPTLAGAWYLEEGTGTTAADSAGSGNNATLSAGASWTSGPVGNAVQLNGTNGYVTAPKPAVRTDQSVSVSAWARLDATGAYATVISQDGVSTAGFFLQYESAVNRWAFGMTSKDATGYVPSKATSVDPPELGTWTHLVGVYDKANNQLRIYVDGLVAGTETHTNPWNATGPVQVGRVKHAGAYLGYFPGAIDEARVYHGLLSDQQIAELFAGNGGDL